MQTWFSLIQQRLDLAWLLPSTEAVPFALTGVKASEWQADNLEALSASHWRLTAHTATGLEAQWEIVFFADTRAVECWGEVIHRGSDPVRGIRESLSLDLNLRLPAAFGQPWVRSVNGIRFVPSFFPPYDYAPVDRQLVNPPQAFPLTLMGLVDGRSSGENLPCAILCDEQQAHGLALFLEWSGLWRISFKHEAGDVGAAKNASSLNLQAGFWGLNLDLKPGQRIPLPRVLITAFAGDLESGGNSLRRHIRRHVTPKLNGAEILPPTSFNHYFTFGNEFTADLLKHAAEACADAGLEYFVVDAGWFAGGFRKGIGNWDMVDAGKFPDGVAAFARFVQSQGMKYGTWFEPEWAHQDSTLYRAHADWFWPSPSESAWSTPANYFFYDPDYRLMNFGLPEVRAWWLDRIVRAYNEWGVRWIRWDFNQMPRPVWEHDVPTGELGWRQIEHVTGLYRTLDAILEACPDLLIEQCAGGGHRVDLGTVRRGHTFWMNDHSTQSDIVRALQHGLNAVLPGNYPNTNLCQKRHDYSWYDYLSHFAGGFGYSGKLWEAPPDDKARFAEAVRRYKEFRHLLLGDYHRPTGQPARTNDFARVEFHDAGDAVAFEFNIGGRREARTESRP